MAENNNQEESSDPCKLGIHGNHITHQEPDGSPEGGYYIVTQCAICMAELGRVHIIG